MPEEFWSGTDGQQSSDAAPAEYWEKADLWPVGAASEINGGNKDDLHVVTQNSGLVELHPIVAIGPKANRATALTGYVVRTESANKILVDTRHGLIRRQYVANVTGYNQTTNEPDAWDASLDAGEPVYVDDSDALASGVTLSRSATNCNGDQNPVAGWIHYCQDDYIDTEFGGLHSAAGLPVTAADDETEYKELCIFLTPYSAQ